MIEIIVGVFLISFILTWALALSFYYSKILPQFESKSFFTLNQNLKKVGLQWSNKNSDFVVYDPQVLAQDKVETFRSFFLIVTLCSLVSGIGLLLLFLVLMTGKSRKERLVFASDLALNPQLDSAEVQSRVEDVKNSY